MHTIYAWPGVLPPTLAGLYPAITEALGASEHVPVDTPSAMPDIAPADAPDVAVVAVIDAVVDASGAEHVLTGLATLADRQGFDLVAIVGDGYLGTDGPRVSDGMAGAAAVSLVRSIAVRSGRAGRANIVCVPESLFGPAGSQRAPLQQPVEIADVANAAAFLLAPTGGYLNGQVLFVNGGRHLFSSMTA